MNEQLKVIFLTGASGVGKTTITNKLRDAFNEKLNIIFSSFDDDYIIPEQEEVFEKWGSWEKWQKETNIDYIKNEVKKNINADILVLDRQTNLDFIEKGFEKINFTNYETILVTCSIDEMERRLIKRNQPELFTEDMKNWIKFLETQAKEKGVAILDTSNINLDESIKKVIKKMNLK